MRPQGMKPRFGVLGQHRQNSPNQSYTRPQFARPPFTHGGPRQLRGNGNQNRHGSPQTSYGPMVGPNGQIPVSNIPPMGTFGPMPPMMMPCGPMMGPNGPAMGPSGPSMGPNGPAMGPSGPVMGPSGPTMGHSGPTMGPSGPAVPPGFMDPSTFNLMMRTPPPVTPVPIGSTNFTSYGFPTNGNGAGPHHQEKKTNVRPGEEDKTNGNQENGQNTVLYNAENSNYNYSQQSMNCGWQNNIYSGTWNSGSQFYHQNSNPNFDPHYSNQGNNQSYYKNHDESYYQYYNQGQPFMQANYYNVQQEQTDVKPNFNQNNGRNGACSMGSKTKKRREMSQKMRTHYCDTCDKSFPTEEALATHLSEHKVCGLDGCKFKAHPKVVERHQRMQHFTGLYRRIGSLYTPEDIEKWKNDRKKNYPTPQNVEERRAKQVEMYARGERMGARNNRFSHNNQQRNGRFQPRQYPRTNQQSHENSSGPPPPLRNVSNPQPPKKWKPIFPPVVIEIEESVERSGVQPFPGTAALNPKKPVSTENVTTLSNKKIESSSLSFLCMYGNSSSDEDSDTEESLKDSNSCHIEEKTEENGEPMIVENANILDNTGGSSKSETLNKHLRSVIDPSKVDTLCTNNDIAEDKIDSSTLDTINESLLSQPRCEAQTKDSEDVIETNEDSGYDIAEEKLDSPTLDTTKDLLLSQPKCEVHTKGSEDAIGTNEDSGHDIAEKLDSSASDTTNDPVLSQPQCEVQTKGSEDVIATNKDSGDDITEEKLDSSTPDTSNEPQCEAQAKGSEDVIMTNEDAGEVLKSFIGPPSVSEASPTFSNEQCPVTDSKISQSPLDTCINGTHQVHDSLRNVPDDPKLATDSDIPKKPCDTASLQESSEEISILNEVHDSSDDSGPEEVPIPRDNCMVDKNDDSDEDEPVKSEGGRKRKRPSRQPAKKLKTEDAPTPNKNEPQQQPYNKDQRRYENYHRPHRIPRPRPPTLLEKLLNKEICHERNVILQCVRYVVDNNYFRGDQSKGDTS